MKDESLAKKAFEQRLVVDNFIKISKSIKINSSSERLRDIIIKKIIARVVVRHLKGVFVLVLTS